MTSESDFHKSISAPHWDAIASLQICRWDHWKSQEDKKAPKGEEDPKLGWKECLWFESGLSVKVLKSRSSVQGATGRWNLLEVWSYEHVILETQSFLSLVLFPGCYKEGSFLHCTTLPWCTMFNHRPPKLWKIRIKRNKLFFDWVGLSQVFIAIMQNPVKQGSGKGI